jgi:hypothetical protein
MRFKAVVLLLLLALAFLFSPLVLLCAELLLNPLAPGSGGILPWLFIGYLLVVIVLPSGTKSRKLESGGLIGLGLLYLLGLIEFILPMKKLGLDPGGPLTFIADGEVSSTAWYHIHNSKAIFGAFFPPGAYSYDPGLVFAPYYPRALLVTHLLLFSAVVISLMAWVSGQKKSLTVALVFTLLVTCVNGGLLSTPVAIALPLYLYSTGRTPKVAAGVLGLLLVIAPALLVAEILWLERLRLLLSTLCAFSLVGLLEKWNERKVHLIGLLLLTLLFSIPEWLILRYGFAEISRDETVFIVSPRAYKGESVNTYQAGRTFLTEVVCPEDTTVYTLCRSQGLNLRRHPILPAVVTPRPYRFVGRGYTKVPESFPTAPHPLVTTKRATYLGGSLYQFDMTFTTPVNINVVAGVLDDLGIEDAVLDRRDLYAPTAGL